MPERNSAPPEGEALMIEAGDRRGTAPVWTMVYRPVHANELLKYRICATLRPSGTGTSATVRLVGPMAISGSGRPSLLVRRLRLNSISFVNSALIQASASPNRRRPCRRADESVTCSSCVGGSPRSSSRRALLGRPSYAVGRPADERPLKRESLHSSGSSSILQSRARFLARVTR
jgi:hypothetical protein